MRPDRHDIAAPVLPGRIRWLNASEAPVAAALTATGPLLVHFFDFAQLNSARSLPYLVEWNRRYREHGLSMLGIHSPRFPFTGHASELDDAIARLGIEHPVADDSGYTIWHDYGCEGWPSIFLFAKGGALSWFHFGEGEYQATENAIAEELHAEDVTLALPEPMDPLRATDAPGALVAPPTPEVFPGGSQAEPWTSSGAGKSLDQPYEAGGAFAVVDGAGELTAAIDGGEARVHVVAHGGLITLAEHEHHEAHELRLQASEGVRVWALSFAAGVAP